MRNLLVTALVLLLTAARTFAREAGGIEMADTLRSSGKIYVVVAVVAVILLALIAYLFTIDAKVKKIEEKE